MSEEILKFALHMQKELDNNNNKKIGWWGLSDKWIINRIKQETKELENAVKKNLPMEKIISECADIANFAMFLVDNLENKEGERSYK